MEQSGRIQAGWRSRPQDYRTAERCTAPSFGRWRWRRPGFFCATDLGNPADFCAKRSLSATHSPSTSYISLTHVSPSRISRIYLVTRFPFVQSSPSSLSHLTHPSIWSCSFFSFNHQPHPPPPSRISRLHLSDHALSFRSTISLTHLNPSRISGIHLVPLFPFVQSFIHSFPPCRQPSFSWALWPSHTLDACRLD